MASGEPDFTGAVNTVDNVTVVVSGTANVAIIGTANVAIIGTATVAVSGSVTITGAVTISSGSVSISAGDVNIYPKNQFLESGIFSSSTASPSGDIMAIFDLDSLSYWDIRTTGSADAYVQFDMGSTIAFKNIYFTFNGFNNDGGSQTITGKIQGSANGTDWTDLASQGVTWTNSDYRVYGSCAAASASYRYIRFNLSGSSFMKIMSISNVKGVI